MRYAVIIFVSFLAALGGGVERERELDLCPKLDITFVQAFSSLTTHTHSHTCVCLVYFYVKRIKKSFLEFRRHKLIFIYDPLRSPTVSDIYTV